MNYDARIDQTGEVHDLAFNPLDPIDGEDRRSRRRLIIGALIVAAVLVGLWFAMHRTKPVATSADSAGQAPSVTVIVPGQATVAGTINATGTLAARRELPVGVAGDGGQIAQVLVDAGAWVNKGQTLAVIDRSVQVQQQAGQGAQIQVTQADARLAQANLDRALKLVDRGFISKADVDRLTATRDGANARVRVSQATLGELRARTNRLNIVAPEAGLILERKVDPGQIVSPGSGVLFRIAKGGEMELAARMAENDLAKLSTGVTAEVTPVGAEKATIGQVWQISPVIDPLTRQGIVRIALPYSVQLRPGGFASAVVRSGTVVAPMLPESAILSDNQGSYVYVIDKANKVVRRPVKTGLVSENGIAIVSGLSGSERVVLRAGGFLQPNETVNPKRLSQ